MMEGGSVAGPGHDITMAQGQRQGGERVASRAQPTPESQLGGGNLGTVAEENETEGSLEGL